MERNKLLELIKKFMVHNREFFPAIHGLYESPLPNVEVYVPLIVDMYMGIDSLFDAKYSSVRFLFQTGETVSPAINRGIAEWVICQYAINLNICPVADRESFFDKLNKFLETIN